MNRIYNIGLSLYIAILLSTLNLTAQNPNWLPPNSEDYTSTANAVTTIYLNGLKSDNIGDRIAVFSGNELRGLSEPVEVGPQQYLHFITIYSNVSIELMSIKIYHQATDIVYNVANPLTFETQGIYGSIEIPKELNIYDDNDAPIFLNTVPFQVTLEGIPFDNIDMENYLVQPDSQGVSWSYNPNPSLQVNFDGSILEVEGSPGFSGFTQLVVRATEMQVSNSNKIPGPSLGRAMPSQEAQVSISYYITPGYAAPLWITIPGEGIVKGNVFTDVNIHDYENQYGGPAIQYDYVPLIQESDTPDPKPVWTKVDTFQTNMSIVASLDYTPKYQFDHEDDILAAYINNEVRGITTRDSVSGLYFISIAGEVSEMDSVTIKFYSGKMKKLIVLEDEFMYSPFQIIGDADLPYHMDLAPIVPMILDYPIPGGYMLMPVDILDTSYLGTEYFEFYAFDPNYPEYLIDTTQTSFCIVSDLSELTTLYADADGDGLGDPNVTLTACSELPGYVTNGDDCDDTIAEDPSISISVMENSAGISNDGFVCALDPVTLNASGGSAYLWSTGDTTSSITVLPTYGSEYKVTVTLGTCKGVATADVEIEGKVVTNTANEGMHSLRSVIACLIEGDTITYDLGQAAFSDITSPILIDKEVSILGEGMGMHPEIRLDFTNMTKGIEILSTKTLYMEDVDLKVLNGVGLPTIVGPGTFDVNGAVNVFD